MNVRILMRPTTATQSQSLLYISRPVPVYPSVRELASPIT